MDGDMNSSAKSSVCLDRDPTLGGIKTQSEAVLTAVLMHSLRQTCVVDPDVGFSIMDHRGRGFTFRAIEPGNHEYILVFNGKMESIEVPSKPMHDLLNQYYLKLSLESPERYDEVTGTEGEARRDHRQPPRGLMLLMMVNEQHLCSGHRMQDVDVQLVPHPDGNGRVSPPPAGRT